MKAETNNYTDQLSREIANIRNKAILTLMVSHDLDLDQVMKITLNDVDFTNRKLAVKSRTDSHPGHVPLSTNAATALAHYLRVRPPSNERKLFLHEPDAALNSMFRCGSG